MTEKCREGLELGAMLQATDIDLATAKTDQGPHAESTFFSTFTLTTADMGLNCS